MDLRNKIVRKEMFLIVTRALSGIQSKFLLFMNSQNLLPARRDLGIQIERSKAFRKYIKPTVSTQKSGKGMESQKVEQLTTMVEINFKEINPLNPRKE